MKKQLHAFISGIVQGVGYRYFVLRHAEKLGLTGFVRNLADGRVEVLAEGDETALKELILLLWEGPSFSRVENVTVEWLPYEGKYNNFRVTY